ncbi:glycosyl hydrolases family 2, sugar binding domain protein [Novosphingobium sp. Rr 2-17]|uniref:beta-mannosidase n=1 Tax=Novosphingobium sp. Rr 2-17 TaxID=555793 RepID=UPI0002697EEA|nr:glycoside hydrolase family 2 protein [Novosphingobium sp. Rr 2-17]EIZ78367.1 glycosyl hydrolases family 2, sugar binding domain protein [Novosphingobium sp. Rr 2-17]
MRFLLGAVVSCLAVLPQVAGAAPVSSLLLEWGWQARIAAGDNDTAAAKSHPNATRWFKARVPGSIQQDLIEGGQIPDPYLGENEAAVQWVGLTDWEMRRTLDVRGALFARKHIDLVFDGLDTFATVLINGRQALVADNGHKRWRIAAKPFLKKGRNEIVVRFASPIRKLQPLVLADAHPLPAEYDSAFGDEPKGRQTSAYVRKPKYHYGWDWGPRIVSIGISGPVRLESWDDARIESFEVAQEDLNAEEARLTTKARVVADAPGKVKYYTWITGPDGKVLASSDRDISLKAGENVVSLPLTVTEPKRWWPVGYGEQPLYKVESWIMQGEVSQASAVRTIGLREVELMQDNGAFGFRVNGVPVFAKGANLIPFDMFPSRVTDADMRARLDDARAANMNMIRVWGGGYYLPDSFYDEADRKGLMIWQDFMFGGAVPPSDAAYRENVRSEAEQQVERIGSHPSVVLWAGGNEVLSGWENWSDRKDYKKAIGLDATERMSTAMTVLFDQVLRDAVTHHAPGTPYWPGSPSSGYDGPNDTDAAGDRHFWDVWSGSKPVEAYTASCPRFMSEYGFQAMPALATIRGFAGQDVLSPDSPAIKAHQKFLAGEGNERLKFYLDARLRPAKDFADFVYLTQVNQAQAIDLAARHHRACAPTTMGSLYWQLNDVWPAISWSSVDHDGRWKLLHYAAARFFAPQAIVAEHREAAVSLAFASDATKPIAAKWRLTGYAMDGSKLGEAAGSITLAPTNATRLDPVPDAKVFGSARATDSYAVAELVIDGKVVSRQIVERALPKDMAYPAPGLVATWNGKTVTITAKGLARAVMLDFATLDAKPADNGFDLLPGESREIAVASKESGAALRDALVLRSLAGA